MCPRRALHIHDSLYPTFGGALQPGSRLGRDGCGSDPASLPDLLEDSIIGHGRRRKQAHDEHHDWIRIRRGLCNVCGKTFTFLLPLSLPYSHYSLLARSQALCRYFLEGQCWEAAAPSVKDPDRVTDPSTLRRWFRSLDSSQPPFLFLRQMMLAIGAWIDRAEILVQDSLPLRWHTVFPFLTRYWPLRL
jgi:hypothetical protein